MMEALLTWCHMGGYALYVWPAYGAVFVVFASLIVRVRFQKKRVWRRLRRLSELR